MVDPGATRSDRRRCRHNHVHAESGCVHARRYSTGPEYGGFPAAVASLSVLFGRRSRFIGTGFLVTPIARVSPGLHALDGVAPAREAASRLTVLSSADPRRPTHVFRGGSNRCFEWTTNARFATVMLGNFNGGSDAHPHLAPVLAHHVLGELHHRMHGAAGPAPLLAASRRCTAGLHWHRHIRVGTARHLFSPPRHQRIARNDNDRRGAVALHLLHCLHRWPAVAVCGAGHKPALGPAES